ncbi:CU044_2847 family protein [Streptomyces luteireticuli]|uniref:Trypsin-co-occurring domain-containing protein n=1 Tax=Streptomyces luteireticuli TaxID=173858 RepID=A0ABN0YZ37_9ACTN
MVYLVELPTDVDAAGGAPDVVKVEIEEVGEGLVQVARPGRVVARASRSLGEMLAGIRPVAEHFVEGFRSMADAPDEIGVEFGVSLSAEADVVISSTAAQANFKVSLTWNRPPADGPDPAAPDPAPDGAR